MSGLAIASADPLIKYLPFGLDRPAARRREVGKLTWGWSNPREKEGHAMFPSSGWGLGCLRLCLLRVWAGEATGRWACGTCQSRLYGSGGSQPEVSRSDPARKTLKEWALLVSPFGRLRARLPCHLTVRPLDPLTYPDGDRVLVTVSGVEGGARALAGLQVNYDEAQKEVTIVADAIDHQASVEVNAPLKFGKWL